MTQIEENTEKAVRYLFGELGDDERDLMEERIFSDEEFAFFLSAVEKDLLDDYARGEMTAALRGRFERKYLISDARREKARVAEILQKGLFAENEPAAPVVVPETKPSFWQALAAFFRAPTLATAGGLAIVLLLLLLGGWILLRKPASAPEIVKDDNENLQIHVPTPPISPERSATPNVSPNENSNVAINADQPENSAANKPSPKASPAPKAESRDAATPPPRIFFATLLPVTRSGATPVLTIPAKAETVQIRVVHDNLQPFIKYRAEIRDASGSAVLVREIPLSRRNLARPVSLNIKNSALAAGAYELTLSGVREDESAEEIKFYNFTVRKK